VDNLERLQRRVKWAGVPQLVAILIVFIGVLAGFVWLYI
jgi:hypothetical protein